MPRDADFRQAPLNGPSYIWDDLRGASELYETSNRSLSFIPSTQWRLKVPQGHGEDSVDWDVSQAETRIAFGIKSFLSLIEDCAPTATNESLWSFTISVEMAETATFLIELKLNISRQPQPRAV